MPISFKIYPSITKEKIWILTAIISLIALGIVSLSLGRDPVTISEIVYCLFSKRVINENIPTIIYNVRMPRIIGAMVVGGALAISGASYQGMFRNPMVSPDILGVTSGAGFGATLGILLSFSMIDVQLMAFIGGLLAVSLSFSISQVMGKSNDITRECLKKSMV